MTDQELIQDYLQGDQPALEQLFERYIKSIYSFVYRYTQNADDAEDIVQDVFVKVWRSIKKYDPEKKFSVWIFTIAKNTALDWYKKKRPLTFSKIDAELDEGSFQETLADDRPLPDAQAEKQHLEAQILSEIDRLGPDYREVILLRLNNDFTFQEIAEIVHKPMDTVKSHYRRAVEVLKKRLPTDFAE